MMPTLWLDYRRAPPGRQRPGWALLILGLASSIVLLAEYAALSGEIESAETRRVRAEARRVAAAPDAADGMAPVATAWWQKAFAALESAGDETVTLLSLRPDPGELRIGGEALNHAAAVDYVARLNASGAFGGLYLAQTEVVREHPRRPVRFAVQAQGVAAVNKAEQGTAP